MQHDKTMFASLKQVLLSWEITENILTSTKDNTLHIYDQYSNGPTKANALLEKENTSWFVDTVLGELQE